jgi:hypothetical protein
MPMEGQSFGVGRNAAAEADRLRPGYSGPARAFRAKAEVRVRTYAFFVQRFTPPAHVCTHAFGRK